MSTPDLLNRTTDAPISPAKYRPRGAKPQKDKIIVNPPDIPHDVTEENKTVTKTGVLVFGRFQGLTDAHKNLIHKAAEVAREHNGTAHVFVSHTHDAKKNPLSQEDKIKYVKKVTPKGVNVRGSSKEEPTPLHAAKRLHDEGHDHLIIVAGSDRIQDLHDKISKYNGKEGHHNFKSIEAVSAGERDPDSEGVEGMSGTKMRAHATAGNLEQFKAGLPKELHPHAEEIMSKVRAGMSVKEEALQEVNLETRVKRAMNLRRYRAKLQQYRKRAQTRYAAPYNLHRKALRYAKMAMRKRFAGEKMGSYSHLNPSQKNAIDRMVNSKAKQIKQIAKRIQPRVSQAELSRMVSAEMGKPKSGTKAFFKGKIQVQSYDALAKKAEQSGYDVSIIQEVFERGYGSWNNHLKTREQLGFERVNSFINGGKTFYEEDRDLAEAALNYERYAKIVRLLNLGLVDDDKKKRFLSILNKMRNISDVDKLQLTDKTFLADLFDDIMEKIVDDNQLFNRMLYLLRRR